MEADHRRRMESEQKRRNMAETLAEKTVCRDCNCKKKKKKAHKIRLLRLPGWPDVGSNMSDIHDSKSGRL